MVLGTISSPLGLVRTPDPSPSRTGICHEQQLLLRLARLDCGTAQQSGILAYGQHRKKLRGDKCPHVIFKHVEKVFRCGGHPLRVRFSDSGIETKQFCRHDIRKDSDINSRQQKERDRDDRFRRLLHICGQVFRKSGKIDIKRKDRHLQTSVRFDLRQKRFFII